MFLYSQWLKLPMATRQTIAANFGIEKKGSTEVFENRIVKDGYDVHEIDAKLTIPALQAFLGTGETNHEMLWNQLIARIEGKEQEKVTPTEQPVPTEAVVETAIPKKRGRPAKK